MAVGNRSDSWGSAPVMKNPELVESSAGQLVAGYDSKVPTHTSQAKIKDDWEGSKRWSDKASLQLLSLAKDSNNVKSKESRGNVAQI